jgi:hypothetical protein
MGRPRQGDRTTRGPHRPGGGDHHLCPPPVRPLSEVMESLGELEAGRGVKALIDVGGGMQ